MRRGKGKTFARIGIIAALLLSMALVPRSAKTFDVDPFSRWWRNDVTYIFESSIPQEWHSYVSQAGNAWSVGPADSWFRLTPYYNGAAAYGFLTKDETTNWYNCFQEVFACAMPAIGPGYLVDGTAVMTVYDDDVNWVVQGQDDCSTQPLPTINVKNVSLHEFGHWLRLWDQPSGHPEAVMSWGCDNKDSLRQDDRDGVQYLYRTELTAVWGNNQGVNATLQEQGGQAHWVRVNGTATTQYWTAKGKAETIYQLGNITNAGSNNRWRIDVDVNLSSSSGSGWSPQLYLVDTSGHWVKVGWMKDPSLGNVSWFVQTSIGNLYWANQQGNTHHFTFVYNPTTKFVAWVIDGVPWWASYDIAFDNPYVLEQGLARAIGDGIDVTFKNFRITTEWSPN